MRALLLLLVLAGVARGEPSRTGYAVVPRSSIAAIDGSPSVIYLNRCVGGCTITRGLVNDARTHTSTIPTGGNMFTMTEFQHSITEWNDFVACMAEVFSPYAVTVTDVLPDPAIHYNEAIVAGFPQEIGVDPMFSGFAPYADDCGIVQYGLSFTFANDYGPFARVNTLCWTAAQEVGHTLGLDHQFERIDVGESACNDPMTYRNDCGGRKFFRVGKASCGEEYARPCRCGAFQQTHPIVASRLGVGTPTTFPTVAISGPADGAMIADGARITVPASAQRGVTRIELWLNDYLWYVADGAEFGSNGQPPTTYQFQLGADVPDGVIDIDAIAYDDLEIARTASIRVTKGAPCASADACAEGQLCDAEGRCYWEPAAGVTGDACGYPQFCINERCETFGGASFCTEDCLPNAAVEQCGDGLECRGEGFCWPIEAGGGCCDVGSSGPPWLPFGALALGFLLWRRRTVVG